METKLGFTKLSIAEFEKWLDKLRVGRTILLIQQHHTFNPGYILFKGNNHFELQNGMRNHHVHHNGWADIGQHFTSFPDGSIVTGRDMEKSPACLKGANANGVCIEHLGNFDKRGDVMTDAHRDTIIRMTAALCRKFSVPVDSQRIVYHHWYDLSTGARNNGTKNNKSCPGTNFFGGNKVADCETNFLPLIAALMDKPIPDDNLTSHLKKYVAVNTASLNVRTKADAKSPKATDRAALLRGAVLRVYKEKDGWQKIAESKNHWISGRFTVDVQRATVNANVLNVRSTPEVINGNVVGSLLKGQEIFIEAEKDGWCKFNMEDKWVSKTFLDFAS